MLCALLALIGPGGSVGFGQMPPESPLLGPDGRPTSATGPAMPFGSVGQGWPTAATGPATLPGQASSQAGQGWQMPGSTPTGGRRPTVPQEEMVVQVRVEGNRTITLDKIMAKIRTRAGRPYEEEQIQQDVRELSKMGVFAAVRTFNQRVQGGTIVIFQVAERPLLKEVIIVGNDTFLTSVLKKEAELKVGEAADPFAVANGRHKIEDYYQKKGYSKVRVTILEGDKAGDLRAVFVVNEGPRQKVLWVNFVGNQFVSSARLKTIVQSRPPWFYLFAGEVDRKQIDEDVKKLTDYYHGFGYFYARVGRLLEFNEKQNWLTITFVIDEGPRYVVRNVALLGAKKIEDGKLREKLKLLSGQYFDRNQQNIDLMKLRDEYGGNGYVFAEIKADNRLLDEPGKLDIVYNVDEGSRYRVGRINIEIKGENPHTQITTVLNRLSFKPGDVVDTREFAASERRLKAAQLYKNEPMKGIEPKIAYSPPESEDKDSMVAGQRRTSYYRVAGGDAPLPPGEGYLDVNVSAECQQVEAAPPRQYATCVPAAYPQPTFQGQTFQQSPYATRVSLGQAYAAPSYLPQSPQAYQQFQTRYEPSDGWAQSQPQPQGQNWPASGYGNNGASTGPYGGQSPQNYPAQQYYNPPAAAPSGPAMAPYTGAMRRPDPMPTAQRLRRRPPPIRLVRPMGPGPITAPPRTPVPQMLTHPTPAFPPQMLREYPREFTGEHRLEVPAAARASTRPLVRR